MKLLNYATVTFVDEESNSAAKRLFTFRALQRTLSGRFLSLKSISVLVGLFSEMLEMTSTELLWMFVSHVSLQPRP